MAKQKTITVEGIEIRFYHEKEDDFISLTDIAKRFNVKTGQIISNWLRTRSTVNFLGAWEMLHNTDFNVLNFENIRKETGEATFVLSITDWVNETNAIGIRAKRGRYGGTYAHRDIAFEFASALSPTFKLYVFKEFQRLKEVEKVEEQKDLDWNLKRILSKLNYTVHTDAIKAKLIPPRITKGKGFIYANEADLLNLAVFGMTAKTWRLENRESRGNLRDNATHEQLLVLANLEAINAEFIRIGLTMEERVDLLNQAAIHQLQSLLNSASLSQLKGLKQIK